MTKRNYIKNFEQALMKLVKRLRQYSTTPSGEWTIKGFIDLDKNIFSLSSDTKLISKILELHILPEIFQFADENNYEIILAEHQNWYPDISFIDKNNPAVKFALDIKTTYRKNDKVAGFTLGSHGAYFQQRDSTKNIQFPYNTYIGHYVLGIIYTRNIQEKELDTPKVYIVEELQNKKYISSILSPYYIPISDLHAIRSVIKDLDFFAAPKWKIASDKQGSGNTANIGSIKDIEDLKKGRGVFSKLGEKWFDEYWMNYGKMVMIKNGKPKKISNIWDFLEFKGRRDLFNKVVAKESKKQKK